PYLEHAFAHLSTTLSHPAVILDHSHYIKSVQCQGHDLEITFANGEAHAFARKAWAKEKDFVLATYTQGCGSSTDQRTFWLVDDFVPGRCDTCITAKVQRELAIEDALHGVDMVWGHYAPVENPSKFRRSELLGRQAADSPATGNCGPAPSARIDGLPTATCNSSTFDQDLDDAIGYLPFDEDDYSESLERFAPGLDDFTAGGNQGFGPLQNTTRLTRRAGRGYFADKLAAAVARTFNKAAEALRNLPAAVVQAAKEVASKVADALAISPEVSLKFGLGVASPKNLTASPWGDAKQLFKKTLTSTYFGGGRGAGTLESARTGVLTVYCVRCGVR
ncbi:MAG: hypothetical protein Q9224_007447, partial [Gallowayella concinna]